MNGITKEINGLAIHTTSQITSLTKGQKALLRLIRDCVENKKPLTLDLMVEVYYENVRKKFHVGEGWHHPNNSYGRYERYIEHDIMECWKAGTHRYKVRPQVRQWFVANIGILVVKNQLVVVPTIEITED